MALVMVAALLMRALGGVANSGGGSGGGDGK